VLGSRPLGQLRRVSDIHHHGEAVARFTPFRYGDFNWPTIHRGEKMAKETYDKIEEMINVKSKSDKLQATIIRTRLILKGINVHKVKEDPCDDPLLINQIKELTDGMQ
jgi:hypothetical protein